MKLDIENIPIVDNHCHPFLKEKETGTFEQFWSLSMFDLPPDQLKHTLLYQLVINELSKLFEIEGATDEEVIEQRNCLYDKDPEGYIARLFNNALIDTILIDIGYPSQQFSGYSVDIDEFSKLVPTKSRVIVRIEPIIFGLLSEKLAFPEFFDKFCATLDEDIKKHNAVAVKTVIAYLSGLEIKKVSNEDAAKAYDSYVKDQNNKIAEKFLMDYLVSFTFEACIRHELPLQIHTGIGDSPIIDLRLSNPLLLYDVIANANYKDLQLVLVHCGYPYTAEAGFLANNYPNVWLDLSEMVPFASIGIEPKLLELLEMSPTNKILYGSDGYNIPEIFWFSSVYFRKCLDRVLSKLNRENVISLNYANSVAKGILSENSKTLYRL